MNSLKLSLAAILSLLSVASQAGVLSSGPVFIFDQATAVCHLTNVGAAPARNVKLSIIDQDGKTVASNACGNLAVDGYCNAVANGLAVVPYSCKATTADEGGTLRGNLDIRVSSQETKIVAPLR
jgi:hypothetical protein